MRALAAASMMLLVIGLLGAIITFFAYILAAMLVPALLGLAVYGSRVTVEKRGRRVAERQAPATPIPAEDFERSVRHPAWQAAIDRRREQRKRLVDRYVDLSHRITRLRQPQPWDSAHILLDQDARVASLESELDAARLLVRQTFGKNANPWQALMLDLEPPRDEVIHLDREFMRTGDCRYGHWDEHAIETVEGGRAVRCCGYCEPNTRWTELA